MVLCCLLLVMGWRHLVAGVGTFWNVLPSGDGLWLFGRTPGGLVCKLGTFLLPG